MEALTTKRFSVYPSPAKKEITSSIGGHDSGRPRGTWVTIKGTNSGELRNENAEAFENILKQYGEIVQPVSTTYYRDVNVPNGNRSCCIVLNRELPDSIDYEAQSGEAYKLYLNWKGKKLYCRYCGDQHELFKCEKKEHDKAKLEKDREEKQRASIIGDSTLRFANNDAVNGDIISIQGAKLGHVANISMYNQDLDTYDTIVIVASNNNYDSNITKEQAKAEIKEQLKMAQKGDRGFPEARRQRNNPSRAISNAS